MNRALRSILLSLLLYLAAFAKVYSQVGDPLHELTVGFNAGALYNSVSFSPRVEKTNYFAYSFGATVRYMCENYMGLDCGLQLEVCYAKKGWNEVAGYSRDLNYIDIPFLAHLAYGKRKVKGILNAGPEFGFLISERERGLLTTSVNAGQMADNKIDYGICGGLGMEVITAIGHFIIEGRYYYGLSDVYSNGKTDNYSRSANNTISIKLTYLYDLLK